MTDGQVEQIIDQMRYIRETTEEIKADVTAALLTIALAQSKDNVLTASQVAELFESLKKELRGW